MGDERADHVVETATRLYAELGYDGTSAQMVADAAGVGPAELRELAGGKAELYLAVMRRAAAAEEDAMQQAVAAAGPSIPGVIGLADAFLDFHLAHPYFLALWMHRWMGDAADAPDLEDIYTRPLSTLVTDAVRGAVPPDVDADHLVWTIVWCVFGFLSGGIFYSEAEQAPVVRPARRNFGESCDPASVDRFRRHLHTLLHHMLTPC